MRTSLKNELLRRFEGLHKNDPNSWVNKGRIEEMALNKAFCNRKYYAETAGRRLRELEEDGFIESQPCGKGTRYRLKI